MKQKDTQILFAIYINDLPEFCGVDHKIYLLNADDAKLYNAVTSKEDQLCVQEVMVRLRQMVTETSYQ